MRKNPPSIKLVKRSKGKIKYKTDPKKLNLAVAVRNKKVMMQLAKEHKVLTLVKKGHTFEEVSDKLGISTNEALDLTKQCLDRWCGDFKLNAEQARELDLKRIDAILLILWGQIEPKEMLDEKGRPVLDARTLEPVMTQPDYMAIKLYKDFLQRRAEMLGLDPEESAIMVKKDAVLERRYIGADPDTL